MRCFILLALIAAASAIPFNGRSRKFNFPCGKGKNFKIPEGAKKIDLKNPTNLPEGWKVVKDPSEMELPDGLTFEDLKNGDVPADWKKIEATEDCEGFVWTTEAPVITRKTFKINDLVVPDYFKKIRDFKSSCDWFTTGTKDKFFEAIGDCFEWTQVTSDELPEEIEFGVNKFKLPQVKDMVKSAKKLTSSLKNRFNRLFR